MQIRLISSIFSIILMTLSLFLLTGCSDDSATEETGQEQTKRSAILQPPEEPAHMIGTITKNDGGKIVVEEDPNEPMVTMKAEIQLTDSTQYLIREGGQYRQAKKEDLKEGIKVEVWYQGIVQDSNPIQANGEYIVLGLSNE